MRAAIALCALLAACGGGGGADSPADSAASAPIVAGIRDSLGRPVHLDFCSSPEYGRLAGGVWVQFANRRAAEVFVAAGGECNVIMFDNVFEEK